MSTDIENTYFDNVTVSSTSQISTNIIDHGPGGRGPGPSRGLYLMISAGSAWTASTVSLTWTLQEDDAEGFGSPSTVRAYVVTTRPAAGELLVNEALPTITKRYSRIIGNWTSAETAGSVSASLTTDPQATFEGRS